MAETFIKCLVKLNRAKSDTMGIPSLGYNGHSGNLLSSSVFPAFSLLYSVQPNLRQIQMNTEMATKS